MRHHRRQFLQYSALSSLLLALPGCGEPLTLPDQTNGRKVLRTKRTVHVDLSHVPHLHGVFKDQFVVAVGGVQYALAEHTSDTKRQMLGDGTDTSSVTHFARSVLLSAEGTQSFVVGVPSELGVVAPIWGAIHFPDESDALNKSDTDVDPTTIVVAEDAAMYVVFRNSKLLTHDPAVAKTVRKHIKGSGPFQSLIDAINRIGKGVTPEQVLAGNTGWIMGEYLLDASGQKIPLVDAGGNPVAGRYFFQWLPADDVGAAALAVVNDALTAIHSDETLEGVKYLTTTGVVASQAVPSTLLGAGSEPDYDFVFGDQDRRRYKRSFHVSRKNASQFNLTVENPNSLLCVVSLLGFDENGVAILPNADTSLPDPKKAGKEDVERTVGYFRDWIGVVPGTYYPAISAALGPASSMYVVDLPKGARTVELRTTTLARHAGDPIAEDDKVANYRFVADHLISSILSGVVDLLVPLAFLASGLGGDSAKQLNAALVKELVEDESLLLILRAGIDADSTILGAAEGRMSAAVILDNLKALGLGLLDAITKLMGKAFFLTVAVAINEIIEVGAGEAALEEAVPFVGMVVKAVDTALEAAQIGIQTHDIVSGSVLMSSKLEPAHEVVLNLTPDKSAYFPQGANVFEATITPSGRTPIAWSGTFDPQSSTSVSLTCPVPVCLQGTLTIDVALYNGAITNGAATGTVVGRASFDTPNGTKLEPQQIAVAVAPVPVPITSTTILTHRRKLTPSASGRTWVEGSAAPTAALTSLICKSEGNVCSLNGITLDQGIGRLAYGFDTYSDVKKGRGAQAHLGAFPGSFEPQALPQLLSGTGYPVLSLTNAASMFLAGTDKGTAVYKMNRGDPKLPTDFTATPNGMLRGKTVGRARIHSAGYLVATTELGVEVLNLAPSFAPTPQTRPTDSVVFAQRGTRLGQLSDAVPVAVAALPSAIGLGVVILEQAGQRLQALDFDGNPVKLWSGQAAIPLPGGQAVYYDVDVDGLGNTWVLSQTAGVFALDVYSRQGAHIKTFSGVNAEALVIDRSSTVFVQNLENIVGPGGYAEPTISEWNPTNG